MKGYDLNHCAVCRAQVSWVGGLAVHAATGDYWATDETGRHHVRIGPLVPAATLPLEFA